MIIAVSVSSIKHIIGPGYLLTKKISWTRFDGYVSLETLHCAKITQDYDHPRAPDPLSPMYSAMCAQVMEIVLFLAPIASWQDILLGVSYICASADHWMRQAYILYSSFLGCLDAWMRDNTSQIQALAPSVYETG